MHPRVEMNQQEIDKAVELMAAGLAWADVKTELVARFEYLSVTDPGFDAFETDIVALAEKKSREFMRGPEAELHRLEMVAVPTVTAINAPVFYETGGEDLIITGTGFTRDCEVTIDGVVPPLPPLEITFRSLDKIVCKTPASPADPTARDVTVTNRNGLSSTLAGVLTFVVVPP